MSKSVVISISLTIALSVILVLAVQFSVAAPLAAPQAGEVTVCTWLGCKPGAVSYTQDDAINISNPITTCRTPLEVAGFRGTFFYDGTEPQSWMATYTAAGHEVGSHLAAHTLNCSAPPSCYTEPGGCTPVSLWETLTTTLAIDNFRKNQIDPNISAIESITNKPVSVMAYPCGTTDSNRKAAAENYFIGARSYTDTWSNNFWWVEDVNPATPPQSMLLYADTTYHDAFVDRAISEGKWAIFTMHDVCMGINYLNQHRADLWVAPVGEILKYIQVRDAARFDNYVETYNSISFDAGHSLSALSRQTFTGTALLPIVFDNPVTLNVDVPINKGVGTILVDGSPVSFTTTGITSSLHSVMFTTTLVITRHVAITLTGPNAVQLQDLTAESNSESGQNLGGLFALIVLVTGGLTGFIQAKRRWQRPL